MARKPPEGLAVTYACQYRRCGNPHCQTCRDGGQGHGPYWYAFWREGGRARSCYVGKQRPAATTSSDPPLLRVRTLGAFAVWRGQSLMPAEQWRERIATTLFMCLLSAPHQRLHREHLMEMLWPQADPAVARHRLRTALYELRSALDDPAARSSYLQGDRTTLALVPLPGQTPPDDWLDATLFATRAAQVLAADDVAACRAALALYSGDYLPAAPYADWAAARRQTLRDQYLAVSAHLARLCRARGQDDEEAEALTRILATDQCQEEEARRLMELHLAHGRRAQALQTYHGLASALRSELDLAPMPATEALRRQALAQPTNLPAPLGPLIGRDEDLATVRQVLGGTRLLTLCGAGGCGKTCLALALAHAVLPMYRDGAWLLDLAPLHDGTSVIDALTELFETPVQAGQAPLTAVAEALRARQVLLLLDNCEHLIEPCVRLVQALLAEAPALQILATSRERLGIPGETVWRVPSLSLPDPTRPSDPRLIGQSAAAQLLVTCARAAQSGFRLTSDNAAAIARICRQLDGIPLALELAAGRLTLLEPAALSSQLDRSFAVLGRRRGAPARHQTLAASIEWSVRLLQEGERVVLGRLAVFVGTWTPEAAAQICADDEVDAAPIMEALHSLLAKSLVAPMQSGRYRLLEPVRQYAATYLSTAGEMARLRASHLTWAMALAESARLHLHGPEQLTWLRRLDLEHDNLRQALSWATAAVDRPAGTALMDRPAGAAHQAVRLAAALARYWLIRGFLGEGRRWLRQALHADTGEHTVHRAAALEGLAELALQQADLVAAREALDESLAIRRAEGTPCGLAASLRLCGNLAHLQGAWATARSYYDQSLELSQRGDDRWLTVCILGNLGLLARDQGQPREAIPQLKASLRLFRELGDPRGVANQVGNLGVTALSLRDYAQATILLEESLALHRQRGDAPQVACQLLNLGVAAEEQGDLTRAAALHGEALDCFRSLHDPWGIAASLTNLGLVSRRRGDADRAVALLEEGLTGLTETGDLAAQREVLEELAALAAAHGQAQRAVCLYAAAATLREQLSLPATESVGQALRASLGPAFEEVWRRGRALTPLEALAAAPVTQALTGVLAQAITPASPPSATA